jgi:hypothetical protein
MGKPPREIRPPDPTGEKLWITSLNLNFGKIELVTRYCGHKEAKLRLCSVG